MDWIVCLHGQLTGFWNNCDYFIVIIRFLPIIDNQNQQLSGNNRDN